MAKVTSPLMSLDASGTIAGALVFSKWKGRNYVRQHVIPSNPQTTAQQDVREALGAAGRFNSFNEKGSPADLALVAAAPSGQSGPSYFAKAQIQRFAASKTAYNTGGNATVKGYFDTDAATLGILPVTIPGDTPQTVPAGLILWNAYQTMHDLVPSIATTTAVLANDAAIDVMTGALSA